MLYWECKRRLALLRQFRVLVFDYFENIEYASWMEGGAPPNLNVKAQKARHEMNRMMGDIVVSFDLLRVPHVVFYQPAPITGGYTQNLDVILNTFDLYSFQIPSEKVFDCTDAAIGAYETECQRLLRKSFNPFYWLGMLIVWVLRLPFKLVAAAGCGSIILREDVETDLGSCFGAGCIRPCRAGNRRPKLRSRHTS